MIARYRQIARDKPFVAVGLLEGASQVVLDRGRWHEFGTENVPQRSFMRSTMKKNKKRYEALATKLAVAIVKGKRTTEDAMNYLGDEMASDIKATIGRNIAPALQPETLASKKRKGYARPGIALMATGEMIATIGRRFGRGRK